MIITKIVKSKKFQSLIYLDGEFYCALDNDFIALSLQCDFRPLQ